MKKSFLGLMALLTILTLSLVLSPTFHHQTPAHAATTILVTTLDDEIIDDGNCSLREAITAANTNTARDACPAGSDPGPDNIVFAVDGTITLTAPLPPITTAITLDGSGRTLVIDGDSRFRAFYVAASGTLTLDTITVQHGRSADFGGGIVNDGTLTVTNSTLSGNSAVHGGGIANYRTLTVTNSTLSGNSADSRGGGIANYSTLTLTSSTLSGNSAVYGGGIYNGGTVTVTSSTLSSNSADFGGGIYSGQGTVTVTSSTLSSNSALNGGGGIHNGGTLTVTNSTLSGNSADTWGGGIDNAGPLTVTSSTLSGNNADYGGGIYNYQSTVTVTSSTLSSNFASIWGGGIYNYNAGTLTVTNSTLSDNSAGNGGGGIYNGGTLTVTSSTLSSNNASIWGGGIYNGAGTVYLAGNIFQQGTSGANCAIPSGLIDRGYNLSSDASCSFSGTGSANSVATLNLGALSGAGPGQQVHLPQTGSAAIGAIPNGTSITNNGVPLACNGSTTDQLGASRPILSGGACTAGAVEASLPASVTIADVSQAEDGVFTFTATLDNATPGSFSVDWTVAHGTTDGADFVGGTLPAGGTLTFAGTAGESHTFTVPVFDDNIAEPTETFSVSLTNFAPTGSFTVNISDTATGTITDDDTAGIVVDPVGPLSLSETGPGTQTFTFTLSSQPTDTVTIPVSVSSSECAITAGGPTISLNGTTWNTGYTVTVEAVDDALVDGAQACDLVTGDPASAGDSTYDNLTAADSPDVSLTITDDDTAGIVVDPTSGLVTTESGGTATFTISLTSQPVGGADVTIPLQSDTPTEGTVPASVAIPNAQWQTGVVVTVTGADDLVLDGDQPYTIITGDPTSADAAYEALAGADVADISVTNQDDDSLIRADDDAYTTYEDQPLTVDATNGVLNGDSGGNGQPLQAVLDTPTVNGALTLNVDGSFTYTPQAGFFGIDIFTYYATDGTNDSPSATVTITVALVSGTLIAHDDDAEMPMNTTITLDVLANDLDPDGDPLHIAAVGQPGHGRAAIENGQIVYTPDPGYVGLDTFPYTAADEFGASDEAVVSILVWQPVPLCADFDGSTNEIIRADVPGGTVTDGSVFCRVLVENALFVRLSAEVGKPEVLSRGVIQAVDVFALYHDGSPTAYFNHPISVCLQGSGVFLYLDATAAPRLVVELPVFLQSGYTCAAVPHAGTVVLVSGRASDVNPAPQLSAPAGPTTPLTECRVTTRDIVNLREQPGTSGTLIRMIPYDVTLTALERTAGWFYVDYLGERGWISAGYVTPHRGCGE